MKLLNELYKVSCKPGYTSYKKITDKITLIDNFFEDFDSARNFFLGREKWQCIPYQNYSKPGYETIFPSWVGKSLLEKYVLSDNIIEDCNSYTTECNHFYPQPDFIWSLGNSSFYPHFDSIETYNGILEYVCLVNLNLKKVSTKFYTFRGKEYCDNKNISMWEKYSENIRKELFEYYNRKTITREEFKSFLDSKEMEIELTQKIEYKPNQAIVYPTNLFHSPNITSEFSEKNPRTLLRITFDRKV